MLATFQRVQANLTLFCIIMCKFTRIFLLNVLVFFTINTFSQNVIGHWYGIGKLQLTNNYNYYLAEMVLRQNGKLVHGELLYYFKDSLVKADINGSFDEKNRKLILKPFPVIYYQSQSAKNSIDCILTGNFLLKTAIKETILTGSLLSDLAHQYTVPAINFQFKRSDDTAVLIKQSDSEMSMETRVDSITASVNQTNTNLENSNPKVLASLPGIKERSTLITNSGISPRNTIVTPTQMLPVNFITAEASTAALLKRDKLFTKELEVDNNQLRIEIYDNGQIDYDSVSLFLNNKLILPKSLLNHKAIRLTIDLDANLAFNELSMLAENLGMIPPNTAALVIYDGKIRYETLLTSDLSRSATIKLVKKK